jgi:hypothetical protein
VKSSEYIAWSLLWDAARRCDTVDAFMKWVEQQSSVIGLELRGDLATSGKELDQRDEQFTRERQRTEYLEALRVELCAQVAGIDAELNQRAERA